MTEYDFDLTNGTLSAIDLDSVRDPFARVQSDGEGRMMASVPTYQGYAAALTRLARLDNMHERSAGRHWLAARRHDAGIQGIWGSLPGTQSSLQPASATAAAEYDIQDSRTAFGASVPLGDFLIGADAWMGQGRADTTSVNGDGDINSDGYAAALTATWKGASGLYADSRLQYANFSTGLATTANGETQQTLASGHDAAAYGASAELGYQMDIGNNISLIPQAQISWTEVTFDGFTDPTLAHISLQDGDTTTARLGLAATQRYNGLAAHAAADLFLPIDARTAINIAGDTATTDMDSPSLSLATGLNWNWNPTTRLSATLATTQGPEAEDYRAHFNLNFLLFPANPERPFADR